MAHSTSSVSIHDIPAIVKAGPLRVAWGVRFFLGLLMVFGMLAFVQELVNGDARRAWMAFHVNFTFWFCVAAASSCFCAVFQICNAQWARPLRRIFDSGALFFRFSPILLVILYLGHEHLFSWAQEPVPGKAVWLSSKFLYARDIIGVLVLSFLAYRINYYSIRSDIGAIRSGLTGLGEDVIKGWKAKRYDRYVKSWGDDPRKELQEASRRMAVLSPAVVIVYAFVMTLVAFDQIMSVDPHWYSTLFGAFYFMSAVYAAVAFASMKTGFMREISPLFLAKVERRTLHDLGKLLFGFGIFWAYLFWSHYLTIWYANIPEETGWLITRTREQPWHDLAWMVLGCCFIIPFFLGLNRDLKQIPQLLFATAAIVALGLWMQQYLLFVPTLYPKKIPLSFTDLFITLGFLGAYFLSAVSFLARVPLMPFGDLYLQPQAKH